MDSRSRKRETGDRCPTHGVALDARGECVLCRRAREKIDRRAENLSLLRRLALLLVFLGGVTLVGGIDLFDLLSRQTQSENEGHQAIPPLAPVQVTPAPKTALEPAPSPAPVDAGEARIGDRRVLDSSVSMPNQVTSPEQPETAKVNTADDSRPAEQANRQTPGMPTEGIWGERDIRSARSKVRVRLYVASPCPECERARNYMKRSGIAFLELDVDKDPDARKARDSLNPQKTTPTITIDDEVLTEFKPIELELAINRAARNHLSP